MFPSHIAYGYHGDNKKIGTNESLICTVTLRNFVPDPQAAPAPPATTPAKATSTKTAIETKKDTLTP
ncbi:hypothetical protein D3C86_2022700 [compost metagenome]